MCQECGCGLPGEKPVGISAHHHDHDHGHGITVMTTTIPIPTPTHTGKLATIIRTGTPLASIGSWRYARRFWKRTTGWRSATAAFSMRAACWC